MKHILLFFGFTVVLISMTIVIINQKEKPDTELVSIQKYYSYLYDEQLDIDIILYINDKDHPLTNIDSYSDISLCNTDETKKIELELNDVNIGSDHHYLNEVYNELTFNLELPNLGEDFWINDLWIKLSLINDEVYKINLGSLSVVMDDSQSEHLNWIALEGHKNEIAFIPRLETIKIDYDRLDEDISKVEIGKDCEVDFVTQNNQLVLTIPYQEQMLNEIPIMIYFVNGDVQNIFNFKYLIEYDILSESGLIIDAYAIN